MYDTIVIGKGPAGISCAVYLKRFNLNPLVIGKDNGALEDASYIDNYYGDIHIRGNELAKKGIEQAESLGIEVKTLEVVYVEYDGVYHVVTNNGTFDAKTLFLAMGKKKSQLSIRNKSKFDGRGVSYCAICDGFFFRKKKIGLVGDGAFMENEYNVLKNFSEDITIFTDGGKLSKDFNAKVVEGKIVDLLGDDKITQVETTDGKYDVDGLFIALGTQSGLSLAYHLGLEMDEKGYIKVNNYKTNLPGIFAGGDVIGGLLQVSKAVSDGSQAALEIKQFLNK